MKEIRTEIIVNATQEQVWETLTDFASYPEWNPFIIETEGKAEVGTHLKNTMRSGGKDRVFKPKVLVADPGKRFEWLGKLPLNLFTGQHYFILEKAGKQQTKLIHGENFGGLLRGMIMKQIGEETLKNFVNMNRALKAEVERRKAN